MDHKNFVARYEKEIFLKTVNFLPATPLLSNDLHSHFNMLHITYVKSGYGTCRIKGKVWRLTPGTVHLVMPGEIHRYIADKKRPYQIYFIHIIWYGNIPEEFPRHIQIPVHKRKKISNYLKELSEIFHSRQDISSNFREYGLFSLVIADILRSAKEGKADSIKNYVPINTEDTLLNHVFKQLYGPPFKSPSIDLLAEYCKMSRRKFTALFKRLTGFSVRQYYMRNVMTYASTMLESKEFKLKDISIQCGYSTSQTFIHAYKKYFKNSHDMQL